MTFEFGIFHLNARLGVKQVNMIGNNTILEHVFLQDIHQYINDYRNTRGWYFIDRNIAQIGGNGPNHVKPG